MADRFLCKLDPEVREFWEFVPNGFFFARDALKSEKSKAEGYEGKEVELVYLRADAEAWLSRIADAFIDGDADAEVAQIFKKDASKWETRLSREAREVEKLLLVSKHEKCQLMGRLRGGSGRQMTYYPDLDEAAYVQRLSAATRRNVFSMYASFDLSSAHLHVAFGAVELKLGAEEAACRCPALCLCTRDPEAARCRVARELGCDPAAAKVQILASLNRTGGSRSPLLCAIMRERVVWMPALRAHPAGAAVPPCEEEIRFGSLLLQAVEAACIEAVAVSLEKNGWRVGSYVADALLARPLLNAKPAAVTARLAETFTKTETGVSIALKVEYEAVRSPYSPD